jgi:hypothetical protein
MREHFEKLQVQIAECEIIRDLATDTKKTRTVRQACGAPPRLAAELRMAEQMKEQD